MPRRGRNTLSGDSRVDRPPKQLAGNPAGCPVPIMTGCLVSNGACTHPSDSFHALPPARVAGLLDPRDPESLRRQCELHAVVHSQLDPRVVEMGPNGGRGYA